MNHNNLILPIGDFGLDHKDDVHHGGDGEAKEQEVKSALQVPHHQGIHCEILNFKLIFINGIHLLHPRLQLFPFFQSLIFNDYKLCHSQLTSLACCRNMPLQVFFSQASVRPASMVLLMKLSNISVWGKNLLKYQPIPENLVHLGRLNSVS